MKKTSDFLKKAIELVEGQRQEDYGDKTINHQKTLDLVCVDELHLFVQLAIMFCPSIFSH